MGEIPRHFPLQEELKEAAVKKPFGLFLDDQEVLNLVSKHNFELIGYGTECVVVTPNTPNDQRWWEAKKNPGIEDVVIALDYHEMQTPNEAKRLFYAHRIMSTLFPHNFPRFLKTYGAHQNNNFLSGSLRRRVPQLTKEGSIEGGYMELDSEACFPFAEVVKTLDELKVPMSIDRSGVNFVRCADGGVYYLDRIYPGQLEVQHKDRVEKYVREKGYREIEINVVLKSIERLEQLGRTNLHSLLKSVTMPMYFVTLMIVFVLF